MGIKINAVVDLAAAFTDEGEPHAIEESQTAADIDGGFAAREVSSGRGSRRNLLDGAGRLGTSRR
jgi:hypothetical protein